MTPAMREALRPPRRVLPSDWAARSKIVSKDAAERGPYRFDRAPYAREIIDAGGAQDPVQEIVIMCSARVSKTEIGRRIIGYRIAHDPVPILIVFPDENTAKRQVSKEILPLIAEHEGLAQYLTPAAHDVTKDQIALAHMNLYPAWAGSAQATADRTIGMVWLDEIDKYADFAGRDAGAIDTAPRRTETFKHRRKVFWSSTPTSSDGPIARLWKSCTEHRYWHVPCPACGFMQRLVMSSVKWKALPGESKRQTADRVEATLGAWYECANASCKHQIPEKSAPQLAQAGAWMSDLPESAPRPLRRGYHLSMLASLLGRGWSSIAAQFLRALAAKDEGDLSPLQEFTNQVLGEPFELVDPSATLKDDAIAAKIAKGYPARVVPRWAGLVLTTADTQRDGYYWTTRAWGAGERSRLIDRGRAATLADLERMTLNAPGYPIDGWPGEVAQVSKLYIDAGGGGDGESDRSLTDEVYRWCKERPGRAQPLRGWGGSSRMAVPVELRKIEHKPRGENRSPYDVLLMWVDTSYWKDVLTTLARETGADARWELCAGLDGDAEYALHMTAERKVAERDGGSITQVWKRISGRPNHYWDAEVYQLAAARLERAGSTIPDEALLERGRERTKAARARPVTASAHTLTTPDGRPFLANWR